MKKRASRTKHIVSLEIVSQNHELTEISRAIGLVPSEDSVERGTLVPRPFRRLQKRFSKTCWRLESGIRSTMSLSDHLDALFAKIPPDLLTRIRQLDPKMAPLISVGIFNTAPMKTSTIETKHVLQMAAHGAKLEISYYSSK